MTSLPLPILALLIATPCAIAIGQVLFKVTSSRLLEQTNQNILGVFLDPVFICAGILYAGATLLWIYVLKMVPLTYAYSFMALTFVFVPILAYTFLGEGIGFRYVIGTTFIITGLVITNS